MENPLFANSLTPLATRLGGLATMVVPIACVTLAMTDTLPIDSIFLLGAAIVSLLVDRRLLLAAAIRRRAVMPSDSPLALRFAKVAEEFGYRPKRVVLIPSMVANGLALPDGSIVITTALHNILCEDEIAAILTHELSHVRDRDARKHQLWRFLGFSILVVLLCSLGGFAGLRGVPLQTLLPLVVTTAMSTVLAYQMIYGSLARKLEYKCDADAVRAGYALDLESRLTKLYRYQRLPPRWASSDAPFMTHPSLAERIAAIHTLQRQAPVPIPALT